jgi:hypothetical protein
MESAANISFKAAGNINFDAGSVFSSTSGTGTSFKCTQYSVTCSPGGFHVDAGSTFRIDQAGFGGDKMCSAHILNARHPGAFPGPIAGFSAPYPGTPVPPLPVVPPDPVKFAPGAETTLEDPNPPAYEDKQGNAVKPPPQQQPPPQTDQFLGREV